MRSSDKLKISEELALYLQEAFYVEIPNELAAIKLGQYIENHVGMIWRNEYTNNVMAIETQLPHESNPVCILFLEEERTQLSRKDYLVNVSPNSIGQRYRIVDSLGNFERVFDMDSLDPIPPKTLQLFTHTPQGQIFELFRQQHIAEHDLFVFEEFITTPQQICKIISKGLIIHLTGNVAHLRLWR
jgi:hypothetical protein